MKLVDIGTGSPTDSPDRRKTTICSWSPTNRKPSPPLHLTTRHQPGRKVWECHTIRFKCWLNKKSGITGVRTVRYDAVGRCGSVYAAHTAPMNRCRRSSHITLAVCGFICMPSHFIDTNAQIKIWRNLWKWCNSPLHSQSSRNMNNLWGNADLCGKFRVEWTDKVRAKFEVMTVLISTLVSDN